MKGGKLLLVLFSLALLTSQCWSSSHSNQATSLREFIKSRSSENPPNAEPWEQEPEEALPSVYVASQLGRMEADEIKALPGQPEGVDFRQYAGYVTVDPDRGRALFYYFVESPQDPASKPLLLWLTGGPTCSSLGLGAMVELGPFRVNSDGETLYRNDFAWNIVANVIFLESPAGVGFSYSNTSSDYATGDKRTAQDSYIFLVNWLERFPRYKHRDLFIVGESYAGHFAPQLAQTIMSHSNRTTGINLKGIAIGNGWFNEGAGIKGKYEFYWTHALNSDETNAKINKFCDFDTGNFSSVCLQYLDQADNEIGNINPANIYEPSCHPPASLGSCSRAPLPLALPSARIEKIAIKLASEVNHFDPCSFGYVLSYLNRRPVQTALHAQTGEWKLCRGKISRWTDSPFTVSPTIKQLMDRGIRVWIYSGDVDPVVPITSSRYAINAMHLSVESAWRPWYTSQEVGGYVIEYKGLTFATVRGAGHLIPSDQPERVLTLISCFLNGTLPSSTS